MSETTFSVSPDVRPKGLREIVDYVGKLRTALRRPIEQLWVPHHPIVACDNNHALLTAMCYSFYDHLPLRLSPDAIWITLARGFALHVNQNAEALRHRLVHHEGKMKLIVKRLDFFPGQENPWPEVFECFSDMIDEQTDGMGELVRANFSTTGPTELAASNLMAMETFKSYFEYKMLLGCGIPKITLTGSAADWNLLRQRAQQFADYGLEDWIEVLDPILEQFCNAKSGDVDGAFWQSMFRYQSGSGFAVMTGWVNVLFPYLKNHRQELYANPYMEDWRERLENVTTSFSRAMTDPQGAGIGIGSVPNCMTAVPLKVHWGTQETDMRLVGGLLAVTQNQETKTVEPECGWIIAYENPVDELSDQWKRREERSD